MAESSEMSMSVQSAWEDLVVENPNRRKLEACLVTTIMCVVVCIMGLLLFVVIQIQPADNLKRVTSRPKITFCDKQTCREFGHRVLGWINWQENPCVDFYEWACGGRGYDAPEKPFQITAEQAGTLNANEEFYNLFVKYYRTERDRQAAASAGPDDLRPVHKEALDYMYRMYDVCIRGTPVKINALGRVIDGYDMLIDGFYNHSMKTTPVRGVVLAQDAQYFENYTAELMKLLNIHPFGKIQRLKGQDWQIMPMTLFGTAEQLALAGFKSEFLAAYVSLADTYPIGNARDNAPLALEVEIAVAKAYASKNTIEDDYYVHTPINLGTVDKNAKGFANVLQAAYGAKPDKVITHTTNTLPGLKEFFTEARKAGAMNLMTFKLFLMFSMFLNTAEKKMDNFFKFANRYYWGSDENPVPAYRCGTLFENYLQPAMHHFIYNNDKARLSDIMNQTKKVLLDFTTTNASAPKSVAKQSQDALNARTPLLHLNTTIKMFEFFWPDAGASEFLNEASVAAYDCGGALPAWDESHPGTFIYHMTLLTEKLICREKGSDKRYLGPVLDSQPVVSPFEEKIYVPYGFTFPPNYHHYSEGLLHHNAPALYFQLYSAAMKMIIFRGISVTPAKSLEPIKGSTANQDTATVKDGIACVRKALVTPSKDKRGATQIYIDIIAAHLAYQQYRFLNHGSFDVEQQLRVPVIGMLTEGQLFFIQAAQARCEFLNIKTGGTYARSRGGALPSDKVNIPFAVSNPLFKDRFGCHPLRPMSKPLKCSSPLKPLQRTNEAKHPNVS